MQTRYFLTAGTLLATTFFVATTFLAVSTCWAGQGRGGRQGACIAAQTTSLQPVSTQESAGLIYMYEEEKLARDVYTTLANQYQVPIFRRISASEQRHMDAILRLLQASQIKAPETNATGVFTDVQLAELYRQLVAKGKKSYIDALQVGATIEDLDIYDLQQYIAGTENQVILRVYQNLAKGSRNHLRAFTGQLQANNTEYTAQYLDQQTVDTILATAQERGPVDSQGMAMSKQNHGKQRQRWQ